jgi:hypothetical protein
MIDFMELTSTRNTPLFVRKSVVLFVEGFTMELKDNPDGIERVGSRLTLIAGQWSEAIVCLEPVEVVMAKLSGSI